MSLRIRPALRSIISRRSIHTSSASLKDTSAPKPADLGFDTQNAGRVRDLGKIDIPATGDIRIDLPGSGSRRIRGPRDARDIRPAQRRPQSFDPYATKPDTVSPGAAAPTTEVAESPSRSAGSTSEDKGPRSRRQHLDSIQLDDLSLPTASPSSEPAQRPAGPRAANREAALQRFRGPRTGSGSAGSRPPRDRPEGSASGERRGSGGPRGGFSARSSGRGGRPGGRPGQAEAGAAGGGRGGPSKKGKGRGTGGGRRGENKDDIERRRVVQNTWHGAPLPPAPPVDTSFTALFGARGPGEVDMGALQALQEGRYNDAPWAEGLQPDQVLSNFVQIQAGSYAHYTPSTPKATDPSIAKDAQAQTLSRFEWQMKLNPKFSSAHHTKSLQEAAAYIQKSL